MKKPNHSDDGGTQNYDPETGKYLKDSDPKALSKEEPPKKLKDPNCNPLDDSPTSGEWKADAPIGFSEAPEPIEWDEAFEGESNRPSKGALDMIAEGNREQLDEAERTMGPARKALYDVYGQMFGLDPRAMKRATDGEIKELERAFRKKGEVESGYPARKEFIKSEYDRLRAEIKELTAKYAGPVSGGGVPNGGMVVSSFRNDWERKRFYDAIPEVRKNLGDEAADDLKLAERKLFAASNLVDEYVELSTEEKTQPWLDVIERFKDPASLYTKERKDNALWCKSLEESVKELGGFARECLNKMDYRESEAVHKYTLEGSRSINMPLVNSRPESFNPDEGSYDGYVKETARRMKLITSALDKCRSKRDMWLQRMVKDDMNFGGLFLDDLIKDPQGAVGQSFVNHGFMSCGAAKGTGNFFARPITLNIYCPKGTSMAYIVNNSSMGDSENEMLINRGYTYVIRKVEIKDGHAFVDLDLQLGTDRYRLSDESALKKYEKLLK